MRQLFDVEIPGPDPTVPVIDERHWYSHSLLLAHTRMGKTNVIRWRIANLLPQIAAGNASVVLMEPKGVLTRDLLNLAHTWDMRDRVVILDPADTPVSVNVFDKGDGSDQTLNETVGRVSRVIGTLAADLTSFQRDTLIFAIRAMFAAPGQASYRHAQARLARRTKSCRQRTLPRVVREFFEYDFKGGRWPLHRLAPQQLARQFSLRGAVLRRAHDLRHAHRDTSWQAHRHQRQQPRARRQFTSSTDDFG